MPTKLVSVINLKEGDLVDLRGDKYADDQTNAVIDYELIPVVGQPVQITEGTVIVPFDYDNVEFPLGHQVKVKT